jgi:hypothetical protein
MASLLFPDDPQQPGGQGLLAIPSASGDWRDTIAPQPSAADAADATAREYRAFQERDRQAQIDQGFVDPQTGERTPAGWKQQAQIIGGGFGPADVGMATGLLGSIKTYHGSPHLFPPTPKNPLGEFDLSKIGTGEGNQSFGKGAYVAEAERVAQTGYRDPLSRAQGVGVTDPASGRVYKPGDPYYEEAVKLYGSPGHMYEVNLNAEPEHFLHYDKPMGQQSEHVQDAIWGSGIEPTTPYWEHGRSDALGSDYVPHTLEQAQRLAKVGIPGVKYLDRSSRGGDPNAPDATHNYAVWSPEIMEIIRRFGIAGLIGGGAAATAAGGQKDNTQ